MDNYDEGTTKCITQFVEKETGCRTMMYKSDMNISTCSTPEQIALLVRRTTLIRQLDSNGILAVTGCLATCEWNEFRHNVRIERWTEKKEMKNGKYVDFAISTKGRYEEMEEYLIYDFNSFIADVGGYLGLLLGQSLYGIYQMGASKL